MGYPYLEQDRLANLLNCKRGSFPMTYLGIPFADRKLISSDFVSMVDKVATRLSPWHGKVIRIHLCLPSPPMYTMGIYRLPKGAHEGLKRHHSSIY